MRRMSENLVIAKAREDAVSFFFFHIIYVFNASNFRVAGKEILSPDPVQYMIIINIVSGTVSSLHSSFLHLSYCAKIGQEQH